MSNENFAALPKETLAALLQMMTDNYRSVDGLWFQIVEEKFGTATATEIDEAVWAVLGKIEARRIKQAMGLGNDVDSLLTAMHHNPSMHAFGPARAERVGANRVLYTVVDCLAQTARLKKGQGEFKCRGVDQGYFESFVAQFVPQARVTCVQCPPERKNLDFWCQWMIEAGDDGRVAVPD